MIFVKEVTVEKDQYEDWLESRRACHVAIEGHGASADPAKAMGTLTVRDHLYHELVYSHWQDFVDAGLDEKRGDEITVCISNRPNILLLFFVKGEAETESKAGFGKG